MPVFTDSQDQLKPSAAYIAGLEAKIRRHRRVEPNADPFMVYNPHPKQWRLSWTVPHKVQKKKEVYDAEVVTCEMGVKIYQIDPKECNKVENRCERQGHILMRMSIVVYDAVMAYNELESLSRIDSDVNKFNVASKAAEGIRLQTEFESGNRQHSRNIEMPVTNALGLSNADLQSLLNLARMIKEEPGAFATMPQAKKDNIHLMADSVPHYHSGDEAVIGKQRIDDVDEELMKDTHGITTSIPATVTANKTKSPVDSQANK